VVPGFCCSFLPDVPPSLTPGSSFIVSVQNRCRHWPSRGTKQLGTPENPAIRFTRGIWGYSGSRLLRPVWLLAPLYGSDWSPSQRGLLLPGFQRVVLPAAGYDYNSDWTPLLAGLSPAGMAASLAALVRPRSGPATSNAGKEAKEEEHAMSHNLNSAVAVIGIDIGKNSFHVVGHDKRGAIMLRQKWSHGQVETRLAYLPPCLISWAPYGAATADDP
jgi:hypothetical protein